MRKTITLPRPHTAYDPRPEMWEIGDRVYLAYAPYVVSSRVLNHDFKNGMYECATKNTIYRFDWAPTIRYADYDMLCRHRRCVGSVTVLDDQHIKRMLSSKNKHHELLLEGLRTRTRKGLVQCDK